MIILGIETSCDETSAALVKNGTQILSNVVASSQELHIKTGGIIPEIAAREQIRCMIPVIDEALRQAGVRSGKWEARNRSEKPEVGISFQNISLHYPASHISSLISSVDAIAVTVGPGLIGSLLVGVETAKTLAYIWNKPIIPVNHLLAHVYANWLSKKTPTFPLIALIVSGGHTELILMKNHGGYQWLGGTRDDAAGEAFDKIARLLELGYPGGPAIAAAAAQFSIFNFQFSKIKLPRPMINSNDADFSFSGLKTAVLREVNKYKSCKNYNDYNEQSEINRRSLIYLRYKIYLAFETQEAITDVLVKKAVAAVKKYNVKNILLAGGVSANQRLREKFSSTIEQLNNRTIVSFPPPFLCADNAAAIASCAYFNQNFVSWRKISADPSLSL